MRCIPLLLAITLACSTDPLSPQPEPDGGDSMAGDPTGGDPSPGDDSAGDPNPGDPIPPPVVYETARTIIHAHSIFSHDGCAGDGYVLGSPESLACLAEMRAAPCALGIDVLSLTDHPSNVQDQAFVDALHYNASAGDQLVMDGANAIGNRVTCPGSSHTFLITAGYEDQHSMPLGLHHRLANADDYHGITDATAIGTVQARVAAMEAAGAVPAIVHSEMDNISAATIRDGGFTAMEWYNIHANIMELLGIDEYLLTGDYQTVINSLTAIDDFMLGSSSGAHPDLVYLAMLPFAPHQGFDKWTAVTSTRGITGILGTDVHRNVELDAGVCEGKVLEALCTLAAELYPSVLSALLAGGTIQLTDNEQLDSYRRVMSWTENRILAEEEITPLTIADALRAQRSYGLFTVFGEPDVFSFEVEDSDGRHPIGTEIPGPGTIHVELPTRPVALPNCVPFTPAEAGLAQIRAVLVFTDGGGRTNVRESTTSFDYSAAATGAYHLEIFIQPLHLEPHLGTEDELAQPEALWLITNPIRVGP